MDKTKPCAITATVISVLIVKSQRPIRFAMCAGWQVCKLETQGTPTIAGTHVAVGDACVAPIPDTDTDTPYRAC
eukprot:3911755-Amphidinium_carterae.2